MFDMFLVASCSTRSCSFMVTIRAQRSLEIVEKVEIKQINSEAAHTHL